MPQKQSVYIRAKIFGRPANACFSIRRNRFQWGIGLQVYHRSLTSWRTYLNLTWARGSLRADLCVWKNGSRTIPLRKPKIGSRHIDPHTHLQTIWRPIQPSTCRLGWTNRGQLTQRNGCRNHWVRQTKQGVVSGTSFLLMNRWPRSRDLASAAAESRVRRLARTAVGHGSLPSKAWKLPSSPRLWEAH